MSLPWMINEEFAGGVQVVDRDGDPVMEWEDGSYRSEAETIVAAVNAWGDTDALRRRIAEIEDSPL